MSARPLCFILMPFGTKPDPAGGPDIDFDLIYVSGIEPGVKGAGLDPIRADEEKYGGIIHKAMFERLLLCEYAVADLTTASANVFYELGIRHAARLRTTLPLYAGQRPLPFDVALMRALPYALGPDNSFPVEQAEALRDAVQRRLVELRELNHEPDTKDSPLFQLVTWLQPSELDLREAEAFQDQVRFMERYRQRLADIRALATDKDRRDEAIALLQAIEPELLAIDPPDVSTLLALVRTQQALEHWDGIIAVCDSLAADVRAQQAIRELLAFALNRRAEKTGSELDRSRALAMLDDVERDFGASAETSGLRGRVYKALWLQARRQGDRWKAEGLLTKAITQYVRGFEIDSRNHYPGVNAVTLLEIRGDEESLRARDRLLPVVLFAAEQRSRGESAGYWDWATLAELAVLARDQDAAAAYLGRALAEAHQGWQVVSTLDNLRLIADSWQERGLADGWARALIAGLEPSAHPS